MNFDEYQKNARLTRYSQSDDKLKELMKFTLGLCGESGEIAEKVKKLLRDDNGEITSERRASMKKELGDVLWYISTLADCFDLSLDEIARFNNEKLLSRDDRGTIHGDGDNR